MIHAVQNQPASIRVLVVEDDSCILETLGLVLESYGYLVDLARDGEAALRILEESQAHGEWPDALLLDLTLERSTGEEVYRRIQDRFGHVPSTVVLSAVLDGPDRAAELGQVGYLAKPYSLDQLDQAVRRAVGVPPSPSIPIEEEEPRKSSSA